MSLVYLATGLIVVVAIGLLAVGRLGELPDPTSDRAAVGFGDTAVTGPTVDALHFSVGLRGYRMGEVDDVLDRISAALNARDERIAGLESILIENGIDVPKPEADDDAPLAPEADEDAPVSATAAKDTNLEGSPSAE